ncbi:MAG: DUF86 domain-containing protein [Deltaproteobacteria bacterium]|nr:DUF86 domain-containing protein [Deltaproteobacteria bacterium]
MRDDRQRLLDVLEAIERIERYTAQGREALERDELVQTWVVHHLQIIGEAAGKLTPELRAAHPEVPWAQIVGTRNVLVHHYFGIDVELVWSTVERDLPALKQAVTRVLAGLPPGVAE